MKLIMSTILAIFFGSVNAQTVDTIIKIKKEQLPDKFPIKRNIEVKYEQFGSGNYSPEFDDQNKGEGKFSNHYRFKTAVTVPFYTTKKWLINASANYKYEVFEFGHFQSATGNATLIRKNQEEYHLFTGGASITRFASLFGKRLIYNAVIIADASDKEFGRIKGMVSATMILSRTQNSSFAIGIMGNIDPSAQIPVLPIVSYQKEFQHSLSLDLFLPRRAFIRKGVFENGRFSLGCELENELLYVKLNYAGHTITYDYRQMELKSGMMYEHNLGHNIIATAKAGLTSYLTTRGVEKGQPASDYTFDSKPDAVGYFSIGISFSPFEKF
jgi:hypothetical protein